MWRYVDSTTSQYKPALPEPKIHNLQLQLLDNCWRISYFVLIYTNQISMLET